MSDRDLLNFLGGKALVADNRMDLVGNSVATLQHYREEYAKLYNEIVAVPAEEKL